jgi:hypothetical protein
LNDPDRSDLQLVLAREEVEHLGDVRERLSAKRSVGDVCAEEWREKYERVCRERSVHLLRANHGGARRIKCYVVRAGDSSAAKDGRRLTTGSPLQLCRSKRLAPLTVRFPIRLMRDPDLICKQVERLNNELRACVGEAMAQVRQLNAQKQARASKPPIAAGPHALAARSCTQRFESVQALESSSARLNVDADAELLLVSEGGRGREGRSVLVTLLHHCPFRTIERDDGAYVGGGAEARQCVGSNGSRVWRAGATAHK